MLALSSMGVVGDLLMSRAAQKNLDQPRRMLVATTVISTLECIAVCVVLISAGHVQGLTQLWENPWLLAVGVQSVIYHMIEIALYRCSWAPVMKPLVNMVALLLLSPAAVVLQLKHIDPVPLVVFVLGVIGTYLVTIKQDLVVALLQSPEETDAAEKLAEKNKLLDRVAASAGPVLDDPEGAPGGSNSTIVEPSSPSSLGHQEAMQSSAWLSWDLAVVLGLALCVSTWQVLQRATHDCCGIHGFAFLIIDQVVGGVMMLLVHLAIDQSPESIRNFALCGDVRDQEESFGQCLKSVFWINADITGLSYITLGKLLANTRVVWSFFLVITYNLSAVFYSITTLRMVLAFVVTSAMMVGTIDWCDWKDPSTVVFWWKCAGVLLITVSFIVLQDRVDGSIF